jgi:hypothetical protein
MPRNSVYLQMSSLLNRLKNKSIFNPLKLRLCGISLHQKSRNSTNFVYGISRNSVEFKAIPYTIRNIKKTYAIPYKRNSENTQNHKHALFYHNVCYILPHVILCFVCRGKNILFCVLYFYFFTY